MLRYSREKMKVEDVKSEAFVQDFPQFLTVEIVKMKPELAVPRCGRSDHDPGTAETVRDPPAEQASVSIFRGTFRPAKHRISHPLTFKNACRARLPSKSESGRCENEAFVRDVLQIPPVEDVIMKLSARLPSKSASGRCENQALARDFPQKMNLESRSCLLFQATFA